MVVVAGSAGLFHLLGRRLAHRPGTRPGPIPPHLLLYASMATIGAVITITADSANDWAALPPRRLLARRAGQTVTGTLTAQGARLPGSEIAAGIVLYALGALLVALIIRQVRGPARTQPVLHAARTRGAATHGGGVGGWPGRPGRLGP